MHLGHALHISYIPTPGDEWGRIGCVLILFYFILFYKEGVKFDPGVHNFNFPVFQKKLGNRNWQEKRIYLIWTHWKGNK